MDVVRNPVCNRTMRTVARLQFSPRPSRLLVLVALAAGACSAALVLWLLPRFVGVPATLACAWLTMREVRELRRPPRRIVVGLDRRITVTDHHGHVEHGELTHHTYVSAWFTTIVWRPDGRRRTRACAVATDTLSRDERRRLRVLLRYSRAESADTDATDEPSRLVVASPPASHD